MSIEKTSFVGNMVFLLVSMLGLMLPRTGGAAALRGSLTLDPDQPDKPVEVTLKKGRRVVSREVLPPGSNNFEFNACSRAAFQNFPMKVLIQQSRAQELAAYCHQGIRAGALLPAAPR